MIEVRPHLRVFGLYVGLTASGYDMVHKPEGDPVDKLIRAIRAAELPSPARQYFAAARSRSPGINPYWPKAAMLLEASFYVRPDRRFKPTDVLALLRSVEKYPVNPSDKDSVTTSWIMEFPDALSAVMDSSQFPELWSSYLDIVQPRIKTFRTGAESALQVLTGMAGFPLESLPDIVVIPNLLQPSELADFVRQPDTLNVVVAEPRMSSMVHELLHDVMGEAVHANREEIVHRRDLLGPVLPAMIRMQYAWADDDESWMRVFEENFMRAAAIWLENERRSDEGDRQAQYQSTQGFIYVPVILRCLRQEWRGPEGARDFVSKCLEACVGTSAVTEWNPIAD